MYISQLLCTVTELLTAVTYVHYGWELLGVVGHQCTSHLITDVDGTVGPVEVELLLIRVVLHYHDDCLYGSNHHDNDTKHTHQQSNHLVFGEPFGGGELEVAQGGKNECCQREGGSRYSVKRGG